MRPVRVALAGCGVVGSAFVEQVSAWNRARGGAGSIDIRTILVRDPGRARGGAVDPRRCTSDLEAFLAEPVDVVVEAVGGLEPAHRIARHALEGGRHWVTANKTLVAAHGAALAEAARRTGRGFGFEAAVAAGVPVVATLRDALAHDEIRAIRGVLNGTTNYLLTALARGVGWRDALREARRRGFAEADPSRDLEGLDAADKIRLLGWLAFGVAPDEVAVDVTPLPADPTSLVREAEAGGAVVRQVAEVRRSPQGVAARVGPLRIPRDAPLARITDEGNLVEIDAARAGRIRVSGPGAGGRATASALLGDVLRRPPPPGPSPRPRA